jgi:hypothetical protein
MWPARKTQNLTNICEPILYKMWEPQYLTTLWSSTVCYRDSFTFSFYYSMSVSTCVWETGFERYEALTAILIKGTIFRDMTPCTLLKINRRFAKIYRLHLQGRKLFVSAYFLILTLEIIYSSETSVDITRCSSYGIKKNLRGFQSASELYRSSDRRRSAKLVPTLADRGCHVVSATSPFRS